MMNQAISGVYQNGQIHLDKLPSMVAGDTSQTERKVVVVFLDDGNNSLTENEVSIKQVTAWGGMFSGEEVDFEQVDADLAHLRHTGTENLLSKH